MLSNLIRLISTLGVLEFGLLIAYLAAVNLKVFLSFRDDKKRAQEGRQRHSENDLLFWAFLGGSVGGVIAQQRFRHKTRKQPFATILFFITLAHMLMVFAILVVILFQA
jgi:uncharacterized membrane protein YsdA (DUF1294 family)